MADRRAASPLAVQAERRRGPPRNLIYAWQDWQVDLGRRELRLKGASVPIGGRALEIMEVLLEHDGKLVAKSDLMATLWPGAFIEENTLQVHISAIRRALGPDRAMLKTVSGRGYALLGAWTRRQVEAAAPAHAPIELRREPNALSNLPSAGSDLIGRAVAMQQLTDFMSAYRVVTLTGAGGIGKTRLALEVARSLVSRFHGDVRFVDLATLADPRLVPSAVAAALGLELGGVQLSAQALAQAIGLRHTLMVLDNCEHLIDGVASLVETVVRTCPHVAILSTSREVLRVEGEYCFRVQPLDVPAPTVDDVRELTRHSAVQFLVLKAQSLRGTLPLDDAELRAAASICRRLDGIPLALEFAAARVASLGADAVLSRLDERFGLLTGGRRATLPKQQTLRATLDWSYDLLTEHERQVLQILSIFPAGCTLEAAAAAAQDVLDDPWSVMDGIGNLVAKSLVAVDAAPAETRWRLLETTRVYASEKLSASGHDGAVRRRHAQYFHRLVAAAPDKSLGSAELASYALELDNIRSALDWAFSPSGDDALGIALTAAFVPVWLQLLLVVECTERIEQALGRLKEDDGPGPNLGPNLGNDMVARLHINLGFALLNTAGLAAVTDGVLAKGRFYAEALGDPALQLRAEWATWSLHLNVGRYHETRAASERLLQIANRTGKPEDALVGRRLLGTALHFLGHQADARSHLEAVLQAHDDRPDQANALWFLVDQRVVTRAMLARVLLLQGHADAAVAAALRSLEEAQQTQDKLSICYALRNAVCPIAITLGDMALAGRGVGQLVDLVTRNGMTFWISWANCLQGQFEVRRGEAARGAALLRAGIGARAQAGWLMRNPEFTGTLAEALAMQGQWAEALGAVSEAIQVCERDGQNWSLPDLRRIEGEILLAQPATASGSPAELAAEICFQAAIEEGRAQGAGLYHLRAALSLAGLWAGQGKTREAVALLQPFLAPGTAGATRDLRLARDLVQRLVPG